MRGVIVVAWACLLAVLATQCWPPVRYQPGVRYPVPVAMQIQQCRPVVGMNPDYCTTSDPSKSSPGTLGI